jgi:hypothetical protein
VRTLPQDGAESHIPIRAAIRRRFVHDGVGRNQSSMVITTHFRTDAKRVAVVMQSSGSHGACLAPAFGRRRIGGESRERDTGERDTTGRP